MGILANGELLLEGAPNEALDALKGKIYSKVVATDDELRALEGGLNVVSTHLVGRAARGEGVCGCEPGGWVYGSGLGS